MIDPEAEPDAPAREAAQEAPIDPDAKLARIQAVIGRWMAERIHNSPVSRSTDAINHLNAQLPSLACALDKEL